MSVDVNIPLQWNSVPSRAVSNLTLSILGIRSDLGPDPDKAVTESECVRERGVSTPPSRVAVKVK